MKTLDVTTPAQIAGRFTLGPLQIIRMPTVEKYVMIDANVSPFDLLRVGFWLFVKSYITHKLSLSQGESMNNDLKTTVIAVVGGIVAILSSFGIIIPASWTEIIVIVLVVILGIFIPKKPEEVK